MAQFSLTWDEYKQNICSGLSALQQSGEFVDMTLAADGHHVKVHQLVLSLVSPYIKELIASAACPHPVIFLNNVSYATLCAILEYIYTGEVHVSKDNLEELVTAAKELHIKGLSDMKLEVSVDSSVVAQAVLASGNASKTLGTGVKRSSERTESNNEPSTKLTRLKDRLIKNVAEEYDSEPQVDELPDAEDDTDSGAYETKPEHKKALEGSIQYTISNQGSLQMILNRYMYALNYTGRRAEPAAHRQWRCVNYNLPLATRCPAGVVTKGDTICKRFSAHNHPFHDKKILKKVRDNAVFAAVHDAEALGQSLRRRDPPPAPADD